MVVTEIRNIPYFDGHCDTIYECMGKGRSLRENSGHVDLMRGQRYGRRAQFFALFDNVRELPEGTAWTKLCQMHDWFCAQAAENADVMALCRTGAEVDAAAAQHKTAALLSIEGADLLDCDMAHLETAASWGVRLLNPVWNNANALCGTCAQECPTEAIDPGDPQRTDKSKCISCMRCVSMCPFSQRRVPKAMQLAASAALIKMCAGRKEPKFYL